MALQQLVCCITVVIIFFCKGCHSQQPACGSRSVNSSSSSITGAHDAAAGSWPWFAYITVDGGPPFIDAGFVLPTSFGFGGSLINDQWVLTAASTMSQNFSSVVVYLGRNSLSGPNPNEVNRTVVNITCHPGFNLSTRENDICLLKLSAPVNFTDYIQPICLASANSTFNNDTSSWTIGFDDFSNNLKEAKVPIVGNNECTGRYSWIPDNIICTGETGSCLANLGAPLMTQSGSIWLQSGVFIVFGCLGLPSAFTPVSQYQKWISDTVTLPSPHSSLQTTAPPTTPPAPPTAPSTTAPAPPTAPPTTTTAPPTTPPAPPTAPPITPTAPPTAPPTSPTCESVFCSGENLIHFTHFTSLCVLVVLLHVFAAIVGN